jgi:hypothetical protein
MVAWRHNFVAVFGVMQDHGAVPHSAVQCNHDAVPYGAMQKGLDCEIFVDLIYFVLKFPKRVNCSHFHERIRHCWIGSPRRSAARAYTGAVPGVPYTLLGRFDNSCICTTANINDLHLSRDLTFVLLFSNQPWQLDPICFSFTRKNRDARSKVNGSLLPSPT